jgi:pyridoxal 5'-phosphate synthase pdxS subunit
MGAPYEFLKLVKQTGKLPVPLFAAGGIATPADASLVMQLGAESVFVGSGIFKSENPIAFAKAIVKTVADYTNADNVREASYGLDQAMRGIQLHTLPVDQRMSERGW